MTERILATVVDYAGLVAALRSWVHELGTTFECIDHVAGLPTRYCAKLLGPVPVRGLNKTSMGPLLATLGLRLSVIVDEPQLERIRRRLLPSMWPPGRKAIERHKFMEAAAALAKVEHASRLASEWGKRAVAAKLARMSPEARQRQASRAANVRWKAARRRIREAAEASRAVQ
jgi:hypothetical protein